MSLFATIKARVSILDVIGEHITLRKAGLYWKGTCPFHSEKTASFTVSPHKEIFYCFGCHQGGDVIAFVAAVEQCSQMDAAKQLADKYQIALPTESGIQKQTVHYQNICGLVAEWFHTQLTVNREASAYVTNRNITPASVNYFKLGYCPGGLAAIASLIKEMKKHHILAQDLIDAGIITQGKQQFYSPFEDRIIFPIKDSTGRVCGFGGRIFKATDTRPKYYNSRENEHFTKGSLLFGLDQAKNAIRNADLAFMVEGYTDCVAMVQHGFPNTVATLGTACSVEHLKQLSRYASTVTVVYDGDNAGQQAIMRLTQLCWQANLELKVAQLPAGEDPASCLNKKIDFKQLIAQAQDIFSFFIAATSKEYAAKPLQAKMSCAQKIIEIIGNVQDPLKQDILLQQAGIALGISFDSLRRTLVGKRAKTDHTQPANTPPEKSPPAQPAHTPVELSKLEKALFIGILSNMQLLSMPSAHYTRTYLSDPAQTVVNTIHQRLASCPTITVSELLEYLGDEAHRVLVTQYAIQITEPMQPAEFERLVIHLQKNEWKRIVHDMKQHIEQARTAGDEQRVTTLVQEFLALKQNIVGKHLI